MVECGLEVSYVFTLLDPFPHREGAVEAMGTEAAKVGSERVAEGKAARERAGAVLAGVAPARAEAVAERAATAGVAPEEEASSPVELGSASRAGPARRAASWDGPQARSESAWAASTGTAPSLRGVVSADGAAWMSAVAWALASALAPGTTRQNAAQVGQEAMPRIAERYGKEGLQMLLVGMHNNLAWDSLGLICLVRCEVRQMQPQSCIISHDASTQDAIVSSPETYQSGSGRIDPCSEPAAHNFAPAPAWLPILTDPDRCSKSLRYRTALGAARHAPQAWWDRALTMR